MRMKQCGTIGRLLGAGWAFGLLLGGCAQLFQPATRLTPDGYSYHKEGKDLAIHWNLTQEDGRVTARGYVQSITPPTILLRLVHLTLVGYDEEGREVIRSRSVFSHPSTLNVEEPPWDQGTFEVSVPVEEIPATRFDLETFSLRVPFSDDEPSRGRR